MNTPHATSTFGFTSMGWPEASMEELVSLARDYKLDFVEIRALGGTTDLPEYFATKPVDENRDPKQPDVRLIATGLSLVEATEKEIARFLRFVDIAILLKAPYVRVFGGGQWGDIPTSSQWENAARTIGHCRAEIKRKSAPCEMLLETHHSFSSSAMCLRLNELLDEPLHLLWDSHHTWRSAGETPAETWQQIGPLVRHMHVSDSRLKGSPETGYDCVLPGSGEYPFGELRRVLGEIGYEHGVSLEWEKIWHPELPDLRLALDQFKRLMLLQ